MSTTGLQIYIVSALPGSATKGRTVVLTTNGHLYTWDGSAWVDNGSSVGLADADYGDVTVSGGGAVWTIDNNVVTNAKAADMATSRIKGRVTAGSGDPEDLTGTQATTLLDTFTDLLKGLAPASGGGTSNFLRADGTWSAPGGGGSATTVEVDVGPTPRFSGKFTITDAGISGTSKVLCWQAPGPYTGKGTLADEAEMQPVQVIAVEPGSGSAVVKWQTPPMISLAGYPLAGGQPASAIIPGHKDLGSRTASVRRVSRVRGNVKFTYQVLA